MTTIALKDGIMAADSKEVFGEPGHEYACRCQKLFHIEVGGKRFLIGTAGDSSVGMAFVDAFADVWYSDVAARERFYGKGGSFTCLVLAEDGAYWYDEGIRRMDILDECFAVGSGAKIALGAMYAGASAASAVEIAARLDPYSGPPIQVANIYRFLT